MATKEATVLAQILGRDLVQPVYIAHLVKGQQGPRAFEDTWNTTKLDYFLETFAWTSGLSNKDASAHKVRTFAHLYIRLPLFTFLFFCFFSPFLLLLLF